MFIVLKSRKQSGICKIAGMGNKKPGKNGKKDRIKVEGGMRNDGGREGKKKIRENHRIEQNHKITLFGNTVGHLVLRLGSFFAYFFSYI